MNLASSIVSSVLLQPTLPITRPAVPDMTLSSSTLGRRMLGEGEAGDAGKRARQEAERRERPPHLCPAAAVRVPVSHTVWAVMAVELCAAASHFLNGACLLHRMPVSSDSVCTKHCLLYRFAE